MSTIYDEDIDEEALVSLIEANKTQIDIIIPYSSLGFPRSHLDIMHDYLRASYCAEEVLLHADLITSFRDFESDIYNPRLVLKIIPKDIDALTSSLVELSPMFAKERDVEDFDQIHILEELEEYADSLDEREFKLPQEVDDYYANLVNGGYYEIDRNDDDDALDEGSDQHDYEPVYSTYLRGIFQEYPERQVGFWKSAVSKTIGEDLYVSSYCWIMPNSSNHNKVLNFYSSIESEINLEKAVIIHHESQDLAVNDLSAISISQLPNLDGAFYCALSILSKKLGYSTSTPPKIHDCQVSVVRGKLFEK